MSRSAFGPAADPERVAADVREQYERIIRDFARAQVREALMIDARDDEGVPVVTTVPEPAPFAIYRGQLYTSSPEDMPPVVRMRR